MASCAASRLDFYLPPPDYRAYRLAKTQHLRDQIAAWRRPPLSLPSTTVSTFTARTARAIRLSPSAAPYYHDHTLFCAPSEAAGLCYGVTANRAESAACKADGGELMRDASFALRARGVELAAAVHAERSRRATAQSRGSRRQTLFARTAEIPIDWDEFERRPQTDGGGRAESTLPNIPNATQGSWGTSTGSAGGRRPMRLYAIRMKRTLTNAESSMTRAVDAPKLGERVTLPKEWNE